MEEGDLPSTDTLRPHEVSSHHRPMHAHTTTHHPSNLLYRYIAISQNMDPEMVDRAM